MIQIRQKAMTMILLDVVLRLLITVSSYVRCT